MYVYIITWQMNIHQYSLLKLYLRTPISWTSSVQYRYPDKFTPLIDSYDTNGMNRVDDTVILLLYNTDELRLSMILLCLAAGFIFKDRLGL